VVLGLAPALALGASSKHHPAYNWTGLYIGGNLGYGLVYGNTDFTPLPDAASFMNLAPASLGSHATDGLIAGGQLGFNWQAGNWVSGLEGDFQKGPEAGVTSTPILQNNGTPYPSGYLRSGETANWVATFRLRTGLSPLYRLFIYLTGGAAYGSVAYSAITDFRPGGQYDYAAGYSKTRLGWVGGIGAEWVTDWNWSVKIEGLYYDLGDESTVANPDPNTNPPYQVGYHWRSQAGLLRVGVNYKLF